MQSTRVVITGMGVLAPNAHGLEAFTEALRSMSSGVRHLELLESLNFACQVGGVPQGAQEIGVEYFSTLQLRDMNENMLFASIVAMDAFRDAGLLEESEVIPSDSELRNDTGAIVGTCVGGPDTFAEDLYPLVSAGNIRRVRTTVVQRIMNSGISATIAGLLGLGNHVYTNSSACCTGSEAIILAADSIRAGRAKRMIAGATESSSPYTWAGFDSMHLLCRKFNDKPEQASRPMSASAAGFVPGCGAAILVLEELTTALDRGARIYAELVGYSANCGGLRNGGTMTSPNAGRAQDCIRAAINDAGIDSSDIDYISGHLTGTRVDPVEIQNWHRALELDPQNFPRINSTKSLIGHAMSASGAIESVAAVLQLTKGFVHGSANCEDIHPDIQMFDDSVAHETIDTDLKLVAKASFGFGDVNNCLVFKLLEDD
jgi:3-oxoacyl-(acyl-carrier-protein) synthase